MGPLGVPELIFILVIALLIFGPKRLPEFGRTIGKALGEFRRASTDLKRSIDVELSAAEEPRVAPAQPPSPAVARDRTEPAAEPAAKTTAKTALGDGEAEPAPDDLDQADPDPAGTERTEAEKDEPEDGSVN